MLTNYFLYRVKLDLQIFHDLFKWGGRWDSNPRSPVPQTGALTNYATSTIFHIMLYYCKTIFSFCQDIR